nr:hypothetical protein [Tanacetum cinerariifolium]
MLFSIHSDEWKSFQSQHQIAMRIRRWRYILTPAESKFKTPMLDHQDKYMMKAQKKAPSTTDKSKGIDLLSEASLLEEAQVKKVLKKSQQEMTIHQAGGSDSDDDYQQANDGRTDSENQMTNDEDEESKDAFVHILEDYVPTDDETNDETKDVYEEEIIVLEKDVKELKSVDNSTIVISEIKYEVPNAIKEYLESSLDDALYKSILADEDAMDKGVDDELKKRKPNDVDKDEGPTAGSDRGLKRQRKSKVTKTGEDLGKIDKQPKDEAVLNNDWYKKSRSDTSPDPKWNEGKLVDDGPEQSWLNDLEKATKPPLTFDKLMHTLVDFSAFAMNRLKIDNLTKEHLGHRFPYDLIKPLPVQMSSQGRQIVPVDFFFNNDLEYLRGGRNDKEYTASMTKSKAARYDLKGVKEMVPNIWSPEGDFKRLHLNGIEDMLLLIVQNKLHNLDTNVVVHLAVNLRVIYEDKLKQRRFMRPDELHKFSDDTLISVRDTLDQMLHELHLRYNTTTRRRLWTRLDQQRTRIMIKGINQKLLDRRIMRRMEKFIGGRDYGEDHRLLQRTI